MTIKIEQVASKEKSHFLRYFEAIGRHLMHKSFTTSSSIMLLK